MEQNEIDLYGRLIAESAREQTAQPEAPKASCEMRRFAIIQNPPPGGAPLFPDGSIVQHRKGGIYRIFAGPDRTRLEKGWSPGYIYRERSNPRGILVVREQREMEDGRFEALP